MHLRPKPYHPFSLVDRQRVEDFGHTKLFVLNPITISAQKKARLIERTAASRVVAFIGRARMK